MVLQFISKHKSMREICAALRLEYVHVFLEEYMYIFFPRVRSAVFLLSLTMNIAKSSRNPQDLGWKIHLETCKQMFLADMLNVLSELFLNDT